MTCNGPEDQARPFPLEPAARSGIFSYLQEHIPPATLAHIFYWLILLVGLAGSLVNLFGLKLLLEPNLIAQTSIATPTFFVLLIGCAGSWLRAQDLTPAARIIYRTSAILVGIYLALCTVPLPPGAPRASVAWFTYAPWIGLAAAALAIWRPTLALIPFGLLAIHKSLTARLWSIPVTPTDWLPIVESTSFLLIGACVLVALRRLATIVTVTREDEIEKGRMRLIDALVIVVIGIHFSNYLWSGIEKVALDGGPISWLLENRTDVLIDVASEAGFFTFGHGFPFSEFLHDSAARLVVPINVVTLAAQLACVMVFWRRSWIVVLTLLFDLQHFAIFSLTGIFFWKWIIFNFAIVAAVSRLDRERIPASIGSLGLAACVGAGHVFFVANLGWYDTRSFNHLHAFAITDDGREIPVPTNFFGPFSVTMAQMDHAHVWPSAFPTGTWGATMRHTVMRDGMACALPANRPASETPDLTSLVRLTRDWHEAMLVAANGKGFVSYDLYPHHIWSDPRRYAAFSALDLRHVAGYRWQRDVKCIDARGHFDGPRLVDRAKTFVPIKRDPRQLGASQASDIDN